MARRIVKGLSVFVLLLTFLCMFAFGVRLALEEDKLGPFSKPINTFSNFPRTVLYTLKQVQSPERFLKVDENMQQFDELDFDLHVLSSTFRDGAWFIDLKNLKNDETLKSWKIEKTDFKKTDREFSNCAPKTPILLNDSSLIFALESSENLYRLDKNNKIIWHNTDYYFHHSISNSADGNLWTCTSVPVFEYNDKGDLFNYDNSFLTKVDIETGKVFFNKSIAEIFRENNLNYLVHGVSNTTAADNTDPIHLNDIESVMNNGPYWDKGDVFFSIRNRSMIIHYRPKKNKIVRQIRGPFYHQHDVDIYNDSTISFFDNHISGLNTVPKSENEEFQHSKTKLNENSRVILYHLNDSSFESYEEEEFQKHDIFTPTQGLHHFMPDGSLFVESTDQGIVFVISKNKAIFKRYLHEPKKGLVEPPHWVRIIN